jgi:hypothetical protein
VKTLAGKTMTFDVELDDTIESLQAKIEQREGIPEFQQKLISHGRHLTGQMKLKDYNIMDDQMLYLVERYQGA